MGMRLGILPAKIADALKDKQIIWIQAVSVGEVMAIRDLIAGLRSNFPAYKLLISTTTPTGNRIARSLVSEGDSVIYFPLDLSMIVRRMVKKVNPRLFITVETEIWPNLITALWKRKIPVILLNGRISPRSFLGYRMTKIFLKKILDKISLFSMQTKTDALRINSLGAPEEKVVVNGNVKFDILAQDTTFQTPGLEAFLDSHGQEQFFVAGSTHRGEEKLVIQVYKEIRDEFPQLRLLLAPRHIERAEEVERLVTKYGFASLRASQVQSCNSKDTPILILDTIGELKAVYARAEIVFIGGSLVKKGGHNILEPAIWGKAVLFGPYTFNFKDVIKPFLEHNAALKVKDREQLKDALRTLLNNPNQREAMGLRAKETVEKNRGATERNIQLIKEILLTQKIDV